MLTFVCVCVIQRIWTKSERYKCRSCRNGLQTIENNVQTLSLAEWMQLPGLTFAEWRNNYAKCVAGRQHVISWEWIFLMCHCRVTLYFVSFYLHCTDSVTELSELSVW